MATAGERSADDYWTALFQRLDFGGQLKLPYDRVEVVRRLIRPNVAPIEPRPDLHVEEFVALFADSTMSGKGLCGIRHAGQRYHFGATDVHHTEAQQRSLLTFLSQLLERLMQQLEVSDATGVALQVFLREALSGLDAGDAAGCSAHDDIDAVIEFSSQVTQQLDRELLVDKLFAECARERLERLEQLAEARRFVQLLPVDMCNIQCYRSPAAFAERKCIGQNLQKMKLDFTTVKALVQEATVRVESLEDAARSMPGMDLLKTEQQHDKDIDTTDVSELEEDLGFCSFETSGASLLCPDPDTAEEHDTEPSVKHADIASSSSSYDYQAECLTGFKELRTAIGKLSSRLQESQRKLSAIDWQQPHSPVEPFELKQQISSRSADTVEDVCQRMVIKTESDSNLSFQLSYCSDTIRKKIVIESDV